MGGIQVHLQPASFFLNKLANQKLITIFDCNFVFKFRLAVEKLTAFLFIYIYFKNICNFIRLCKNKLYVCRVITIKLLFNLFYYG